MTARVGVVVILALAAPGCDDPCGDGTLEFPPASIIVDVLDGQTGWEVYHRTRVWEGDELLEEREDLDQLMHFYGLYGVFDVEVTADGYRTVIVEDLEVRDIGDPCPEADTQVATIRLRRDP